MSEELTQIIAECTEAVQSGRLTIDECLETYPEYRAELTDLLIMVTQVRTLPRAYPRSEFRQQARGRLLAQLESEASAPQTAEGPAAAGWLAFLHGWWQQNPQIATAGALALFVGLFAMFIWQGFQTGEGDEPSQVVAEVEERETIEPTADMGISEGDESPTATAVPATEVAAAPLPSGYENSVFIPLLSGSLELTAQTAAVEVVEGVVELQQADGQWMAVTNIASATAGQHIRTKPFSSATVRFFDGSYVTLGPDSELSLDTVDAQRPENGFRTLVMTQWAGESDHEVAFRNDGGSLYEVKTPDDGSGIARGTKFKVIFKPGKLSRFIVTEGKVDVKGKNRTVSVIAGQVTVLPIGVGPIDPVYSVSGEGEVTATGATWTIAGQTFLTDEYTIIVGKPQVGDLVHVDGHLLADGSRVADRIVLIRRAVVNEFSLSGEVEEMGAAWVVAGQTIVIGSETVIDEEIAVGDSVRVDGVILGDGILQAQVITLLEDAPGLPFQFSGLAQTISDDNWVISGQPIKVDGNTAVDDDIELDDIVSVRGWLLEDGSWLATEIRLQEDTLPTFEFTGLVQAMNPWRVAGVTFETRAWTIIGPQINVGDQVRVRGIILSDGTKVAESVTLLSDLQPNVVTFIGVVSSANPWIVNGLPLVTNSSTVVVGEITVGMSVVVKATLQPDGNWTIVSIRPLYPEFGLGCLYLNSPVTTIVNNTTIQVRHWRGNINLESIGDIGISHVVSLPLCTGWNGTTIIINSGIIVIYQPVVIIIDDGGNPLPPGCKITKKGNIKCSKKSSKKS